MKERLTDLLVHAFIVLATAYVVCGNIYLSLQARQRPIPLDRAAVLAVITVAVIAVVYAAYIISLRHSYERRSRLSTAGFRMHVHALAFTVGVYLLLAVISGGWTHIAWPAVALPMQFLWWLALANIAVAVVVKFSARGART